MKNLLIVFVIVVLFATIIGCAENTIPKEFFQREISFTVDPEAEKLMVKTVGLLAQIREEEMPLSDKITLPLYREADMDRNHRISLEEAKGFYEYFILKFEDSLGPIKFKPEE